MYLVTVFGELDDQDMALAEILRVLRPRDLLSLTEHVPDPDFTRFSVLQHRCEDAGFGFVERFGRPWNYPANFIKPPIHDPASATSSHRHRLHAY